MYIYTNQRGGVPGCPNLKEWKLFIGNYSWVGVENADVMVEPP